MALKEGKATGGTKFIHGGYTCHAFTASGSFAVTHGPLSCEILVVAGGGAGGSHHGSSGGAGGLLYGSGISLNSTHVVSIGAGGTSGSWNTPGSAGGNSTMTNLPSGTATALGGGYGAKHNTAPGAGGSGGGSPHGSYSGGAGQQGSSAGLSGYGTAGSVGNYAPSSYGTGGGGGAGQAGNDSNANWAGDGGKGKDYSDVFGPTYGEFGWFAGGGGGATYGSSHPAMHGDSHLNDADGGRGGGGDGHNHEPGQDGLSGTGGGGGAHDRQTSPFAGNGGSGIVIVRYST